MFTFIVNPNARTGRGLRTWKMLEEKLAGLHIDYRAMFTAHPGHATELARKLTQDGGLHKIVILGGDGTVGEVIQGITDLKKATVGYIPIGSSNDFARGLGLTTDPAAALSHILAPREYTYINVGILSLDSDHTAGRRFAVSAGIGFDAGVCRQVAVSKLKKVLNHIGLGKLSYAGVAVSQLLFLKPGNLTLTLDHGEKRRFTSALFAAVMNGRFEGGGFDFCPDADPGDDKLNVIVVAGLPRLFALLMLPTAFKGWHTRFKGVYTYTCQRADIQCAHPLPVHTDGEPLPDKTHICASLEPDKLRIILS